MVCVSKPEQKLYLNEVIIISRVTAGPVAESEFPSLLSLSRAGERYHLSGKQSGKSDRVLDIDTALPPSQARSSDDGGGRGGRGASLGNMLTLLASEGTAKQLHNMISAQE